MDKTIGQWVVSKGKCNNNTKEKVYWKLINNQQGMPYIAGPKQRGYALWWDDIKFKFSKYVE